MSCTYVTAVATHIGYQSSESIKVSIKLVHHANSGKVLEISIHGTFIPILYPSGNAQISTGRYPS